MDRKERARLKNVKFTGRTTSNTDKVSLKCLVIVFSLTYVNILKKYMRIDKI